MSTAPNNPMGDCASLVDQLIRNLNLIIIIIIIITIASIIIATIIIITIIIIIIIIAIIAIAIIIIIIIIAIYRHMSNTGLSPGLARLRYDTQRPDGGRPCSRAARLAHPRPGTAQALPW